MIALIPLVAAIVGILVYVLVANAKVAELGRLLYFAGVLVWLLSVAHQVTAILK